jgi:hypothetical protein
MSDFHSNKELPIDLGDGLILRRSTPADTEKLVKFNAVMHKDLPEGTEEMAVPNVDGPEDQLVGAWTRDLMSGKHPTFGVGDFTLVENIHSGQIVSTMNLIDQTWTYAGVPFGVGRPELVGTLLAYRNRGLVRKQFEIVHQWSKQRGQVVQAITGIPYYYRLFGYEMAVDLDGGRSGVERNLPRLKSTQPAPFLFRPAQETDIPFISQCYAENCKRDLLACVWDQALWRHELLEKSPLNVNRRDLFMIDNLTGETLGFIALTPNLQATMLPCSHYSLKPGVSWLDVTPYVLHFIWDRGQELARLEGKKCDSFGMWLHENHPVFQVAGSYLVSKRDAYAWYLRVPDLAGFLRLVTPVLEKRLAESLCTGFSGTFNLSFYQKGIRLAFEKGCLASVENYRPAAKVWDTAAFPGLTFLQLLFGYRSLDELEYAFPDCWVNDSVAEFRPVINALFPKQNSTVWPIS